MEDKETLGEIMAQKLTKQYNRIRKLENMIRHHASGSCKCRGPNECMTKLYKLVPLEARPTLHEAHKRAKQRKEKE